jgi:hypothetical protein
MTTSPRRITGLGALLAIAAAVPMTAASPVVSAPQLKSGKKRHRRYYDPGARPFAQNFLKPSYPPAPKVVFDADAEARLARAQAKRDRKAAKRRAT